MSRKINWMSCIGSSNTLRAPKALLPTASWRNSVGFGSRRRPTSPQTWIFTLAGRKMAARTFLDTLFVIALLNQRDQYHECAAELAVRYEGEQFLTTDTVLLEIGNALAKKYRQEAV